MGREGRIYPRPGRRPISATCRGAKKWRQGNSLCRRVFFVRRSSVECQLRSDRRVHSTAVSGAGLPVPRCYCSWPAPGAGAAGAGGPCGAASGTEAACGWWNCPPGPRNRSSPVHPVPVRPVFVQLVPTDPGRGRASLRAASGSRACACSCFHCSGFNCIRMSSRKRAFAFSSSARAAHDLVDLRLNRRAVRCVGLHQRTPSPPRPSPGGLQVDQLHPMVLQNAIHRLALIVGQVQLLHKVRVVPELAVRQSERRAP